MLKKGMLISGLLLLLLLVFGISRNTSVDAARTISENDQVSREVAAKLGKEYVNTKVNSVKEDSVSGNDATQDSEQSKDSETNQDTSADTNSNQNDMNDELDEEGCLYVIPTEGNRLGSVSVVGGNAVVLMPQNSSVWQGDYDASVVDGQIIDWSFYQKEELTSYEIPKHVKHIGSFAFARSGLNEITIPNGVTSIGYAAFYHCDQLLNVSIPDSVVDIQEHAFENTPWMKNFMESGSDDFLIVGDGILLAYRGNATRIQLPKEVKRIAEGAIPKEIEIIE